MSEKCFILLNVSDGDIGLIGVGATMDKAIDIFLNYLKNDYSVTSRNMDIPTFVNSDCYYECEEDSGYYIAEVPMGDFSEDCLSLEGYYGQKWLHSITEINKIINKKYKEEQLNLFGNM